MHVPTKILNDGVKIPVIGLGTWQLEGDKCTQAVKIALEIGYNHIDTAYAYYNQTQIGQAIKGCNRENLFITSKLWRDHLYPEKVEIGLDECLKQLGVDYIDLFLVHWPDNYRPMLKIVEKMHALKEKKKIRSVGVSNYTIHHLQDLIDQQIPVSLNQVEYHPYLNQKELFAFCKQHNIAVTAYSPIAQGKVLKDPVIKEIANNHQKSPTQVSLKWLLQKGMNVIPKGSSREHIQENFELFDFTLSAEDMQKIEDISKQGMKRIICPDFQEFDY